MADVPPDDIARYAEMLRLSGLGPLAVVDPAFAASFGLPSGIAGPTPPPRGGLFARFATGGTGSLLILAGLGLAALVLLRAVKR